MAALAPYRTDAAKGGRARRYWAFPQFVRLDPLGAGGETWSTIADVLTTTRDAATGAYQVALADGRWIRYAPRRRPAGSLTEAVVGPVHFGDRIDAAKITDGLLQYDVTFSAGVEHVEDPLGAGWQFTGIDDCALGLFLADLIGRFGDRVTHTSLAPGAGRVDIDVSGLAGMIDLDPSPYGPTAQTGYIQGSDAGPGATWAAARGTGDAAVAATEMRAKAQTVATGFSYVCERGFLQFDTSDIGTVPVEIGYLYLAAKALYPDGLNKTRIDHVADYATLMAADFNASSVYHVGTQTWASVDVYTGGMSVPTAYIDPAGNTCFLIREDEHDDSDDGDTSEPGNGEQYGAALHYSGAYAAYLDVRLQGGAWYYEMMKRRNR